MPGCRRSMRALADYLAQTPSRRILIEGHTDSVGTAADNAALSRRRADAVDAALEGMGLAARRVTTVSYAEDYPVAENDQPVKQRR